MNDKTRKELEALGYRFTEPDFDPFNDMVVLVVKGPKEERGRDNIVQYVDPTADIDPQAEMVKAANLHLTGKVRRVEKHEYGS